MLKHIITKKGMRLTFVMLLVSITSTMASEVIRLMVKENRAACMGVGPMNCLQVKYKTSKDWSLFYSEIQGFKYKEGYRYTLSVIKTKRKNVPADASAYTYKLKKILKKQKITAAVKDAEVKVPSGSGPDPLAAAAGQKWTLTHLNGKAVAGTAVHLTLDPKTNKFSGSGGCNTMFGSFTYEAKSKVITLGNVASTLMACGDAQVNQLENEYSAALNQKTFTLTTTGQSLTFSKGGKKVLEFSNGATGQSADIWKYIADHQWKLIQMNGETQESSPVTIAFKVAEKRFNGNSGCNNYFGTYQSAGSTVTFGPAAGTRMACSNEKLSALENKYLAAIGGKAFTFDVADQTLNFYQNDRLVLMFGLTK